MPKPCEEESKKYEENKDAYEDAYNEYSDFLDEEEDLSDDIELTKEAEMNKMIAVGIISIAAGAFSAGEEYKDPGPGRGAGAFLSGMATATSTAAAGTDYFDYEKDLELAKRSQERLYLRKKRSQGRMEKAEKNFLDSEKDLYHCEHGQSKEYQYDEYGNPADEDEIDTSYGDPDIDDDEDDFTFTMEEATVEDELPDGDEDIRKKEYKNVADSEGDYYDQSDDMPDGDADLPDYMPPGDLD